MSRGTLYGVGVGPGDPKLMTLKAVETIGQCPVVAAPRTRNGGMVALDIAKGAVDLEGKTILPLDFTMSREAEERTASHRVAAAQLRRELDAGHSVAMLNLGDISIYASFRYVADILGPEGYDIKMIPGVTSFCAAASSLGISLTDLTSPLYIIPDGSGEKTESLARAGTSVYMKSGKNMSALLGQLEACGLLGNTMLVQNCGMENERIYDTLAGAKVEEAYFTVVIVRNGNEGTQA